MSAHSIGSGSAPFPLPVALDADPDPNAATTIKVLNVLSNSASHQSPPLPSSSNVTPRDRTPPRLGPFVSRFYPSTILS
ncbi:hypothetical protein LA080_004980 [Diaporthe eres]|nr:hypothetical protein LA080_004980 [Diaporthe eres]